MHRYHWLPIILLIGSLLTTKVVAHPVDVYVQATYITLTRENIIVDVDLSAGVLVAPAVLALIDTDADGTLSEAEGSAYADEVLSALRLEANDQPIPLTLTGVELPTTADLISGFGVIRLHLSAPYPAIAPGHYQLFYVNRYAPVCSAYLVNGFVQADAQAWVDITQQERDWYQQTTVLDYTIFTPPSLLLKFEEWLNGWIAVK